MTADNWLEQTLAEEKRRREHLPSVKTTLCAALKAKGIAKVSIEYDGEGDSGQVNDIQAFDQKQQPVSLDDPFTLALHNPEEPTTYASLYEALDDFAWTALGLYHDGFVNNDGGFGAIAIDAEKATVTIDHNDRITDVDNTVTEV